jgi:hypothetical protein
MLREVYNMGLLKLALEKQRWDLAAHTIVLAAVRVINQGMRPDGKEIRAKKRRAKG